MAFIIKNGILHAYYPEKGETTVTIPAGVHTICDRVFEGNKTIETLIVPEGVTRIEWGACKECTALRRVVLPKSVTFIGDYAFSFCEALEEVVIPEEADAVIERETFLKTPWLAHLDETQSTILVAHTLLKYKAAPGTKTLTLPEETHCVASLYVGETDEDRASFHFKEVTKLVLPDGVRYLCENALSHLPHCLADIVFPPTLADLTLDALPDESEWEDAYREDERPIVVNGTLLWMPNVRSAVIPDDVVRFSRGFGMDGDYDEVKMLHIGASFHDDTFLSHPGSDVPFSALQKITVSPENPHYLAVDDCLTTRDGKRLLLVPCGAKRIRVPDGVEVISAHVLDKCEEAEIILPDSLRTIEDDEMLYFERISFPHGMGPLPFFGMSKDYLRDEKASTEDRTVLYYAAKNKRRTALYVGRHLFDAPAKLPEVEAPADEPIRTLIHKGTRLILRDADGLAMRFDMQADWRANRDEVLLEHLLFDADDASRESAFIHLKAAAYKYPLAVYDAIKGSAVFQAFVKKNIKKIVPFLIDLDDADSIARLLPLGFVTDKNAPELIAYASKKAPSIAKLLLEAHGGAETVKAVKETVKRAAKAAEPVPAETLTAGYGAVIEGSTLVRCTPPKKVAALVLPDTITAIAPGAFQTAKIGRLVLPETVTQLPDDAFRGAAGIGEIEAMGVVTVGERAFCECKNLKSVTFGDALTTLAPNSFWVCAKLTEVTLGAGLTTVDWRAFDGCHKLERILIAPGGKRFASYEGTVFDRERTKPVFIPYARGELVLPPSVKSVPSTVFQKMQRITSVVFDLRGTSAAAFAKQAKSLTFHHRSVAAVTVRTDTDELTLDLAPWKDSFMYQPGEFEGAFPHKNAVKGFVSDVIHAIVTGDVPDRMTTLRMTGSVTYGGIDGVYHHALLGLRFEVAHIIAKLHGLDERRVCETMLHQVAAHAAEAAEAAANGDKSVQAAADWWRYFEQDPAHLPAVIGEETARRATLDLWLDHADLLRTLSTEDLDVLLADAVSANKTALSALLLQIKHERDSSGQGRMTL